MNDGATLSWQLMLRTRTWMLALMTLMNWSRGIVTMLTCEEDHWWECQQQGRMLDS